MAQAKKIESEQSRTLKQLITEMGESGDAKAFTAAFFCLLRQTADRQQTYELMLKFCQSWREEKIDQEKLEVLLSEELGLSRFLMALY